MGNKKTLKVSWNQVQGEMYQSLFQAEAYRRKLLIEKSDVPLPWDFTVTNPKYLKRPIRVQVKGTNSVVCNRYRITNKSGGAKVETIDDSIIDVASFYVEPTNTWYNIPASSLRGHSVWLYPHVRESKGSYECWRHDWSVFEA